MADPFSIVAGTFRLTDVCLRVGVELRRLIRDTDSIGKGLDSFATEVSELEALCKTIRDTFEGKPEYSKYEQPLQLGRHLEQALSNCHGVLDKADGMIQRIRGAPAETPLGKVDSVKAMLGKRLEESNVQNWRVQLTACQRALQLVLTAITLYVRLLDILPIPRKATNTRPTAKMQRPPTFLHRDRSTTSPATSGTSTRGRCSSS